MVHTKDAVQAVHNYVDAKRDKIDPTATYDYKVYIVASSYILGCEKFWLSTTIPDGKYFEVTYNKAKDELYLDVFVKIHNECIKE